MRRSRPKDDDLRCLAGGRAGPLGTAITSTIAKLRRAGIRRSADLLRTRLAPLPEDIRALACWLIGRLGTAQFVRGRDRLLAALDDPSIQVRVAAVQALERSNDPLVARQLATVVVDDGPVLVRVVAAGALSRHPALARHRFIRILRDRNQPDDVRGAAAEGLAYVRGSLAEAVLLYALDDRVPAVRYWAAFSLGERGSGSAVPKLNALAKSDRGSIPCGSVRKEASAALTKIERRRR